MAGAIGTRPGIALHAVEIPAVRPHLPQMTAGLTIVITVLGTIIGTIWLLHTIGRVVHWFCS